MHKLAFVALIGLTASAAFIGAAAAIGGKSFSDNMDLSMFGDRPRCEAMPNATATTREMEWDGSDHVGLSVGGHASWTPGTDNKVHASGDPQMLAHLQIRDGRIELDCNGWHHDAGNVTIILPGQEFKRFSIAGSGNLALNKLDQAMLKVSVAGSGSVKADGKVEHAEIRIAGSGDVDMGQVASQVSDVHISGSGDTDIAPSDEADIRISGSGDVNLHSHPNRLESHISGSGRIHNITAGG
jgi:hypothetical protein